MDIKHGNEGEPEYREKMEFYGSKGLEWKQYSSVPPLLHEVKRVVLVQCKQFKQHINSVEYYRLEKI